MQRSHFIYKALVSGISVLLLVSVSSCSKKPTSAYRDTPRKQVTLPHYENNKESVRSPELARAPWELWAYGRDIQGEKLADLSLIRADELLRHGDRPGALALYRELQKGPLSPNISEAVAIRAAGISLALGDADGALLTVSQLAKDSSLSPSKLDPIFSIVTGYAYAKKENYPQSIAWLAQALENATPRTSLRETAAAAIRRVLRAMPSGALDVTGAAWRSSITISQLVSQERSQRARSGIEGDKKGFEALFNAQGTLSSQPPPATPLVQQTSAHKALTIGVILPLSGVYQDIGESLRNGAQLALEGFQSKGLDGVSLDIRDSKGSADEAKVIARGLVSTDSTAIILGPATADESVVVSEVARESRVPLLSFSKRKDFSAPDLLYRFAPTAELQVLSLVDAIIGSHTISKIGIVTSDDPTAQWYRKLFTQALKKRDIGIAYDGIYQRVAPESLIQLAKEVEQAKVQGIFFPGEIEEGARFFSALSESARKTMKPLALANWDSPYQLRQAATIFDGAMVVTPFFRESQRPIVKEFVTVYKSRFGKDPDIIAAQGFDAATIVLSAIRRNFEEGISLVGALDAIGGYEGLTGLIHVDGQGEIERRFPIVQLKERELYESSESPPAQDVQLIVPPPVGAH